MKSMSFLKGMGVGLVVGSAIGMAVMPSKKSKHVVGKALKSVGEVIDNVSSAIGW